MSVIICSTNLASGLNLTLKAERGMQLHYSQKPQLQIHITKRRTFLQIQLLFIFNVFSSNIFLSPSSILEFLQIITPQKNKQTV